MISGVTIIRNGIRGAYPFMESIMAVVPYVDEYIVGYDSDDGTREILNVMAFSNEKIRPVEIKWDLSLGVHVIADVTNKAMEHCSGDWIIHNQADEVYTREAMEKAVERINKDENFNAYLVNRVQTGLNFQEYYMGESGAYVARIGRKGKIRSDGDGLSMVIADDKFDYLDKDSDNFDMYDITRTFLGNFPGRSRCQQEIWWMNPNNNSGGWFGKTPEEWNSLVREYEEKGFPEECFKTDSPYKDKLPKSLVFWIGKPLYYPRLELLTENSLRFEATEEANIVEEGAPTWKDAS
jgi:hypothetical protein